MDMIIVALYIISLVYFGVCFMGLGVCYGDPRSAQRARRKFLFSFALFFLMTIVASILVSIWFAVPLLGLVLFSFTIHVIDKFTYRY